MRRIYLDVKVYKTEPGPDYARALANLAEKNIIAIYMSYWVINESLEALDRAYNNKHLSEKQWQIALSTLLNRIRLYSGSNIHIFEIAQFAVEQSINYIRKYKISADDALHVCTACIFKCDFFVAADKKMIRKIKNQIRDLQ
jgi:predicted nucleic acid-binding protein